MTDSTDSLKGLRARIHHELNSVFFVDPHTHIDPRNPSSSSLADILGYHYYTELAHSAGLEKEAIERGCSPKELVHTLVQKFKSLDNTIQYSWFTEMLSGLFDIHEPMGEDNWESIYDQVQTKLDADDWCDQVFKQSKLTSVFLTNDFDDPLEGFDTSRFIPCLRTDDLVFHLAKPETQSRLNSVTGLEVVDRKSLDEAIENLFQHFISHQSKACAISLPPCFSPEPVLAGRAEKAIGAILANGLSSDQADRVAVSRYVFWKLAENCAHHKIPFDLMIGVNRGVYEAGVFQGQDLYDSRLSLIQYKELFNSFPDVTFPVSVLASVTNQELTSYAWIFPNIVTHGHWWYSNTPTYIEHDAAARMEAVPRDKQIGYYSDMYKMEFALPKFGMYKRILAKILAEKFVVDRGWSEEAAIEFGTQVLRDNSATIFSC
ncbi:MAG: glucuronate isomerase [Planctomycetota bacterium]|nr:glucuronate isomerase [Planctomycetota bacterium]